ncbi:hypothetical protein HJC99_04300 [Candidatus Saccharibacteria bacterium]|nr:hypothetical protein [Candidatus Saccharibacteria bacterium]
MPRTRTILKWTLRIGAAAITAVAGLLIVGTFALIDDDKYALGDHYYNP